MNSPQIGEVYYQVTFADQYLKVPQVAPWEFVGTNLVPEDAKAEAVTYYFRYPRSASEVEADPDTEYFRCTETELGTILTLLEAAAKLILVAAGVDLTRPPGHRGLNL